MHEESRKNQSVTEQYGCGKCEVMHTNKHRVFVLPPFFKYGP